MTSGSDQNLFQCPNRLTSKDISGTEEFSLLLAKNLVRKFNLAIATRECLSDSALQGRLLPRLPSTKNKSTKLALKSPKNSIPLAISKNSLSSLSGYLASEEESISSQETSFKHYQEKKMDDSTKPKKKVYTHKKVSSLDNKSALTKTTEIGHHITGKNCRRCVSNTWNEEIECNYCQRKRSKSVIKNSKSQTDIDNNAFPSGSSSKNSSPSRVQFSDHVVVHVYTGQSQPEIGEQHIIQKLANDNSELAQYSEIHESSKDLVASKSLSFDSLYHPLQFSSRIFSSFFKYILFRHSSDLVQVYNDSVLDVSDYQEDDHLKEKASPIGRYNSFRNDNRNMNLDNEGEFVFLLRRYSSPDFRNNKIFFGTAPDFCIKSLSKFNKIKIPQNADESFENISKEATNEDAFFKENVEKESIQDDKILTMKSERENFNTVYNKMHQNNFITNEKKTFNAPANSSIPQFDFTINPFLSNSSTYGKTELKNNLQDFNEEQKYSNVPHDDEVQSDEDSDEIILNFKKFEQWENQSTNAYSSKTLMKTDEDFDLLFSKVPQTENLYSLFKIKKSNFQSTDTKSFNLYPYTSNDTKSSIEVIQQVLYPSLEDLNARYNYRQNTPNSVISEAGPSGISNQQYSEYISSSDPIMNKLIFNKDKIRTTVSTNEVTSSMINDETSLYAAAKEKNEAISNSLNSILNRQRGRLGVLNEEPPSNSAIPNFSPGAGRENISANDTKILSRNEVLSNESKSNKIYSSNNSVNSNNKMSQSTFLNNNKRAFNTPASSNATQFDFPIYSSVINSSAYKQIDLENKTRDSDNTREYFKGVRIDDENEEVLFNIKLLEELRNQGKELNSPEVSMKSEGDMDLLFSKVSHSDNVYNFFEIEKQDYQSIYTHGSENSCISSIGQRTDVQYLNPMPSTSIDIGSKFELAQNVQYPSLEKSNNTEDSQKFMNKFLLSNSGSSGLNKQHSNFNSFSDPNMNKAALNKDKTKTALSTNEINPSMNKSNNPLEKENVFGDFNTPSSSLNRKSGRLCILNEEPYSNINIAAVSPRESEDNISVNDTKAVTRSEFLSKAKYEKKNKKGEDDDEDDDLDSPEKAHKSHTTSWIGHRKRRS